MISASVNSSLAAAVMRYAAAARLSAEQVVAYAARQVAQHAQKETILVAGRGDRGRASTVAQAKRDQLELWRSWVLTMGFPRMGRIHHRKTDWRRGSLTKTALRDYWFRQRMPSAAGKKGRAKKAAEASAAAAGTRTREQYFAEAKRRQGELAAGWNAAIDATGGKYAAAWVRRHGDVHGKFAKKVASVGASAVITFEGTKDGSRGSLASVAALAVKKTEQGLRKSAEAILRAALR